MKKFFKGLLAWIQFLLSGKGEIADEAVDDGLVDFSGQGRDRYGN